VEESNILIAIVVLAVGGVIGYFAGRSSATGESSQKRQVDELKTEINQYKDSVANHFQQTATMINEMNDSYKSVVQHLAQGSQDLCDAGTAKDIESRLIPKLKSEEETIAPVAARQPAADAFEPPRDYAPKKPDEAGTLSENYGVKAAPTDSDETVSEPITQPDVAAPKN